MKRSGRLGPWAPLVVVGLLVLPIAGCLGGPGRDIGIPRFILVPGTGATSIVLGNPGPYIDPREILISPLGSRIVLPYSPNRTEIWDSNGTFHGNFSAPAIPAECNGSLSLARLIDEDTMLGLTGACALLLNLNGSLERVSLGFTAFFDDPSSSVSADGLRVVTENGTYIVAREAFGAGNITIPKHDLNSYRVDYHSLSADGTMLAVVTSTTRVYRLDWDNSTARLIASFPRIGPLFFSPDSARALQLPDRSYGLSPNSIAFYDFAQDPAAVREFDCNRSAADADVPRCPPSTRGSPIGVSPSLNWIGWTDLLSVQWAEEDAHGQRHGNRTDVTLVRLFDGFSVNGSRGFAAGNVTGRLEDPAWGLMRPPGVLALRLFDDGSALALAGDERGPRPYILTRADANATLPTAVGTFI